MLDESNSNDVAQSAFLAAVQEGLPEVVGLCAAGLVPELLRPGVQVLSKSATAAIISAIGAALGPGSSERQRYRGVRTILMALTSIVDNVNAGIPRRSDDFYAGYGDRRPEGEEFIEGALRTAASTYEESKLRVIAALIANVDLHDSISGHEAQFALKTLDRLTYAQLCMLAKLSVSAPRRDNPLPEGTRVLVAQLEVLADEGLVGLAQADGRVAHYAAVLNGGTFRQGLEKVALSEKGVRLAAALNLELLASARECDEVWEQLLDGR